MLLIYDSILFDSSFDPPFTELIFDIIDWIGSLVENNMRYALTIIVISFGIVAALFGLLGHVIRRGVWGIVWHFE
jgi:hypothetical protein